MTFLWQRFKTNENVTLGLFYITFRTEIEGYRGGHFEAYLATFLRRIRPGGVSESVPVELTAGLTPVTLRLSSACGLEMKRI